MRRAGAALAILSATLVLACRGTDVGAQSRAFARPVVPPYTNQTAYPVAPAPLGPYRVDLVASDGTLLPVFSQYGARYVLGLVGERYAIRIANPTANRVEAVVSVDGLDVVDGRPAGYAKRGYILAPYGEAVVEGFRTSTAEVATFRFSTVRDSYAGRQARSLNVGVIGVAFFPERDHRPSPVLVPMATAPRYPDEDGSRADRDATAAPPAPAATPRTRRDRAAGVSKASPQLSERHDRPGLGTEFGERRLSQVEYRRFERQDATSPAWVYEIRYDDREGLLARGLPASAYPSAMGETELRDRADPFPARRFAEPPPLD